MSDVWTRKNHHFQHTKSNMSSKKGSLWSDKLLVSKPVPSHGSFQECWMENSQSLIRCEGGWLSTRCDTTDKSYMQTLKCWRLAVVHCPYKIHRWMQVTYVKSSRNRVSDSLLLSTSSLKKSPHPAALLTFTSSGSKRRDMSTKSNACGQLTNALATFLKHLALVDGLLSYSPFQNYIQFGMTWSSRKNKFIFNNFRIFIYNLI